MYQLHTPDYKTVHANAVYGYLQEFMTRTKGLEDRLMAANREKELLEGEAARMPGNGRTLAERNRKRAVETQLGSLGREIGTIRMNLKQMGALRL
jgi:hypothetical protein